MKKGLFENPPMNSQVEMANRDHKHYNQALSDLLAKIKQK